MSMAALIRSMAAAGAPAEAIALAVEAIEQAQACVDDARAAAAGRKRRQRERERDTSRDSHETVTGQSRDEPAPSPLPSPQTPYPTPHPPPEYSDAYARGSISLIVLRIVVAGCRAASRPKARWPKDMPPPPGVSDDQWAGFIDHRIAKRERLTLRAYQLLCGKLAKYADAEWPPGRIIDHIVERRWTSFEPEWLTRSSETRNGQRPHHDRPAPGAHDLSPMARALAKREAGRAGAGE